MKLFQARAAMPLQRSAPPLPAVNRLGGFTLIELMVVLALVVIIASLAVPSYRTFATNQALTAASNDFFVSLAQTRSEAMRLNQTTIIMPVNSGLGWAGGWRVFADNDGDGSYTSGTDVLIGQTQAIDERITIEAARTTGSFSSPTPPFFSYSPVGFANSSSKYPSLYSGALNGKLGFLAAENGSARVIIVEMSGRARVCNPATDTGTCSGS